MSDSAADDHQNMGYDENNQHHLQQQQHYSSSFEVSDFLDFDDWMDSDDNPLPSSFFVASGYTQGPHNHAVTQVICGASAGGGSSSSSSLQQHEGEGLTLTSRDQSGSGSRVGKKEKVAFRTKSQVEILDDGYKWRKYGKKMVKNSPNPRNYYRCSVEGCPVKKRVERDKEDPKYVITAYEGIHNHQGPSQY